MENGKSISNSFCSRLHQQPAKYAGRAQTKVELHFATATNTVTDTNTDAKTHDIWHIYERQPFNL